jgi:glycosyltransferase involved in cell wall biosynthesis
MEIVSSERSRPLRVLMIAPTSFFSDYGGHIRILEETKALQALNQQVAIVTYYKGSDMPGLDIRRTAPLPWHTDYEVGSSRHKIAFDVYLAAQSLAEGVRYRPDIIHGHMHEGALIGGVLARILNVPMVFDFQGSLTSEMVDHDFLDENSAIYSLARRLERVITTKLPSAILTSSNQAAQILENEFGVRRAIIHPLPDCADAQHFYPQVVSEPAKQELRRQLGIPDDKIVVAYLGLLTDYQGTPYLIEAADRLKDWGKDIHFLVMGYPNVEHYRALAADAGLQDQMTFTGKIEYRDAPRFLSLGDIAVAPKLSTTEGSGKILNYMAMAQPVVAFDTPVSREYLGELGQYAPVGDGRRFAEEIAELAGEPQRRREIGLGLRRRVENEYSWSSAGRKILSLYSLLTSEQR